MIATFIGTVCLLCIVFDRQRRKWSGWTEAMRVLNWNFVWQGQMYLRIRWKDTRSNEIEVLHQW